VKHLGRILAGCVVLLLTSLVLVWLWATAYLLHQGNYILGGVLLSPILLGIAYLLGAASEDW
jgi:hypothetical protein